MSITTRIGLAILLIGATWAAYPAAPSAADWEPPTPKPESKDWVRLSSGEWVRGAIELLQYEKMYFDSEEMDDLEFDWEDVAEIRSARILTVGMIGGKVVSGTVAMSDGIMRIRTGVGVEEYSASQVLAIIEGRPTELNYWSLKATANLVARTGNTEQNDFTSFLRLRRQTTRSQFNAEYRGNYGSTDGESTVANSRVDVDANWFLSRQLFVTPLAVDLFNDEFQNIDLRSGLSAGFGYYLIRSKTDWQINASGGYQKTTYISVGEGEDLTVNNGTITLGTTLEMDLTKNIELDTEYSIRRTLGTDETTLHHSYFMLSFDILGDIIDFTASVTWDHNSNPKTNAEGITPKSDDVTMAYGLGVDF